MNEVTYHTEGSPKSSVEDQKSGVVFLDERLESSNRIRHCFAMDKKMLINFLVGLGPFLVSMRRSKV